MKYDGSAFYFTRLDNEPPREGGVSFQDLLSPISSITSLLVTAMYTDPPWLKEELSRIPRHAHISVLLDEGWVMGRGKGVKELERVLPAGEALRCVRPVKCPGLMHAKLILVRFQDFLRVAVVSTNLGYQWVQSRDAIWAQDFSLLPDEGRPISYPFGRKLRKFCEALDVPQATLDPILSRVWFEKAGAELVPSVPLAVQKATGQGLWDDDEQGHMCLRRALSRHAWPLRASEAPVFSVSGSLGDLSYEWLQDFCDSLTSDCRRPPDASTGVGRKRPRPPSATDGQGGGRAGGGGEDREPAASLPLRIMHPTNQTMWTSSQRMILCVNMNQSWWSGRKPGAVPRELFYDCVEKEEMQVPGVHHPVHHMKVLLRVVPEEVTVGSGELAAWLYLGSHNLSKSAWGGSPVGPRGRRPGPNNVELGVLLVTIDPAVRDQWVVRHPLRLPGRGAAKYELAGLDVTDRRDHRSPFTGGRGWDSEFRDGKTGKALYCEDRRAFLAQRYPHLTPDRWPGGPVGTEAGLGYADGGGVGEKGEEGVTSEGWQTAGEVAGGKGSLTAAGASEEGIKGVVVLGELDGGADEEEEEEEEEEEGSNITPSMVGTAQDVAFWDDED